MAMIGGTINSAIPQHKIKYNIASNNPENTIPYCNVAAIFEIFIIFLLISFYLSNYKYLLISQKIRPLLYS